MGFDEFLDSVHGNCVRTLWRKWLIWFGYRGGQRGDMRFAFFRISTFGMDALALLGYIEETLGVNGTDQQKEEAM